MIIEFFGLSNTGKSLLKRNLQREGYNVSKTQNISKKIKLFYFIKHLLLNSKKTTYLFYKLNSNQIKTSLTKKQKSEIKRMRNSYLIGVLAKHQILKNKKQKVFTDEFSFQSLFMILNKRSNINEIKRVLNALPKSDFIFLFIGDKKLRYNQYTKKHPIHSGTLMPGSGISKEYAKEWMKTMECNFNLTKNLIQKNYQQDNKTFNNLNKIFKKLKLKNLQIYKIKD